MENILRCLGKDEESQHDGRDSSGGEELGKSSASSSRQFRSSSFLKH